MGRIIPFLQRRRRRPPPGPGPGLRFWPERRISAGGVARDTWRWLGRLRPLILGAVLLAIWPAMDA